MPYTDDDGNVVLLDVQILAALHGLMKDTKDDKIKAAVKQLLAKPGLCSDLAERLTKILVR